MLDALGPAEDPNVAHRAQTIAHLANLRIEQGRLEEAAELLEPYEDWITTCGPLARVHLRRGDVERAVALLRRGLDELVGDNLRSGSLLALAGRGRADARRPRRGAGSGRRARRPRAPVRPAIAARRRLAGRRSGARRAGGRSPARSTPIRRPRASSPTPGGRSSSGCAASSWPRSWPRTTTRPAPSPRRGPRWRPSNGSVRPAPGTGRRPCCGPWATRAGPDPSRPARSSPR